MEIEANALFEIIGNEVGMTRSQSKLMLEDFKDNVIPSLIKSIAHIADTKGIIQFNYHIEGFYFCCSAEFFKYENCVRKIQIYRIDPCSLDDYLDYINDCKYLFKAGEICDLPPKTVNPAPEMAKPAEDFDLSFSGI